MIMDKLEAQLANISRLLALIGLLGLILLSLATIADVFMRWIFNSPITGVRDTYSLFLGIILASSFPLLMAERGNITIRFLGKMLGYRAGKMLDLLGGLATMGFIYLAASKTWQYANELIVNNDTTWLLMWPTAPWWKATAALLFCSIVVLIIVFIQDARSIRSGPDIQKQ
jgi:TRAP-type C4-dicarboxylate transport system permease small subunit